MSFYCTISCQADVKEIFEQEAGMMDRSSLKVESKKGSTLFTVVAHDVAALKASVNLVLKALAVYEKTVML